MQSILDKLKIKPKAKKVDLITVKIDPKKRTIKKKTCTKKKGRARLRKGEGHSWDTAA